MNFMHYKIKFTPTKEALKEKRFYSRYSLTFYGTLVCLNKDEAESQVTKYYEEDYEDPEVLDGLEIKTITIKEINDNVYECRCNEIEG